MRKHTYTYLAFLLLFTADIYAGVRVQLFEEKNASCNIKAYHDAVPGESGVIVLKSFDTKDDKCEITQDKAINALDNAINNYKVRNDLSEITSIFLGRLISYKWLSDYLLKSSITNKNWNVQKGRPRNGTSNKYVNSLMYRSNILEPFSLVLSKYDYKMSGVSCEKILINKEKLPFDGMCWLTIQ